MTGVAASRAKYVDASEASRMLDGLLSPRVIRELATSGQIPGAVRASHRVLIPRRAVAGLVQDLCATGTRAPFASDDRPLQWHDRRGHTLLDEAAI